MIKRLLKKTPLVRNIVWRVRWLLMPFPGTSAYWEERYASHGDSGRGSDGAEAEYKANVINTFIRANGIGSVIDFGCGDGRMLTRLTLPAYRGFDISASAIQQCRSAFAGDAAKSFAPLSAYAGEYADLALSLDVIYHLVEDDLFERHMRLLFGAARRFVILYSSHSPRNDAYRRSHIRQREFLPWIKASQPEWELLECVLTPASVRQNEWLDIEPAFFFFRRRTSDDAQPYVNAKPND